MLTEVLCESLQSLQANAGMVGLILKLGHDRLLPNYFSFFIISLSFDPTLYESPKNVLK
jgi:hypothetical protein